jgi:hypothetical protein
MFWLIEDISQLKEFYNKGYKEVYIDIIPTSMSLHPAVNSISAIYIRPVGSCKGYMLTVDHIDTLSLNVDHISKIISHYSKIFTPDKKNFLHYFKHKHIVDLSLLVSQYEYKLTKTHDFLIAKNLQVVHINKIIPIVKHFESCEINFSQYEPHFTATVNTFLNVKLPLIFNYIESCGLKVDPVKFQQYFKQDTEEDLVYTQYNYNTTTTRPSNSFNSINFAALNKSNNCRKSFIPKNDYFVEIDISSFHPILVCKLINYKVDTDDLYGHLNEMYETDYNTAKELTFKQLYGGIYEKYKHFPFFKKTQKYIDNLWETFNNTGQITVPISKHTFVKANMELMTPQKLFNYYLQALETAYHTMILWDVIKLLKTTNTDILLYVYDSILLDVDAEEKHLVTDIINVYKQHALKVKVKKGTNYNDMFTM